MTKTVLVVDDQRLVRMTIRYYLEEHGFRVLEAGSRDEARSHIGATPVDVLLTDIVLPGTDGQGLARELRQRAPDLRVLYMSAHPTDVLRSSGRLAPGDAALEKPFTASALVENLRAVLR